MTGEKLDFCVKQILDNNFAYRIVTTDDGLIINDKAGNKLFDLFYDDLDVAKAHLNDIELLSNESMKRQVKKVLESVLPSKTEISLVINKKFFSSGMELAIAFYPKAETVNNVRGQYPEKVSLALDLSNLELRPQIYGGNGGRCIYRTPDENHSYLAMQSIKIPFRKPKPEVSKVLAAVKRFAERWLQAIKDNKDVLMHPDLVNYDEFLNS